MDTHKRLRLVQRDWPGLGLFTIVHAAGHILIEAPIGQLQIASVVNDAQIWRRLGRAWVLTIAPTGHRDEETIAIVLDANGQGILGYIVATGYGLLLETIVGEGKVQLIPAIALLQLVGSLTHSQQEQQQRQDALHLEQHVVDWAGTRLGIHLHNWPKKKEVVSLSGLVSFAGLAARRRCLCWLLGTQLERLARL